MRHKFWLFLVFAFIANICYSQGYNIVVKFSHYTPQKVRLAYYYEDKQYLVVDSAAQSGSVVTFKGDKKLPAGIYSVFLNGDSKYFDVLIDDDNQNFVMKCDCNDIQKTMKVTGSDVNSKFFDYQRRMTDLNIKISKIDTLKKYETDSAKIKQYDEQIAKYDDEYQDILNQTVNANKGTILSDMLDALNARRYSYEEMFDHVNFAQPGLIRTPFFYNIIRVHIAKFIESGAYEIMRQNEKLISLAIANEDVYQYVTGYLLNFYRTFYKVGINEVFVHLADKYFLAKGVRNLPEENRQMIKDQRDIYAASTPGSDAKNIKVRSFRTGDSLQIFDNFQEGLLLLFWANGCGHCDSAENAIKYYYPGLCKNKIKVISVCNDRLSFESMKSNSEKKEFPWIDCCDIDSKSRYREYYYVVSTPILYFINKDKVIVNKFVGENYITEAVQQLSN